MDAALLAALIGLAVAGVAGGFMPRVVRALPEPPNAEAEKTPYAVLGGARGLSWRYAVASGLAGGVLGAALGLDWSLLFLLYLCPVGVALAHIDWSLRLLPTALIGPSYLVVGVLAVAAALLEGEPKRILGSLVGWIVVGGLYWLLWRFTPGMGYGDVRLSGLVGIALGWFGGEVTLVGAYAGFLLGVVCWAPMRLLRLTTDRSFPFGPFMLLGIVVGVVGGAVTAG